MKMISIASGVALSVALLSALPASAEERVCRTTLGAVVLDNVRVPQGARCNLIGSRVKGTIKVETNATLVASNVVVIGNVQGENARNVRIVDRSRIGGSVQVVQGFAGAVEDSTVNADILYDENNGPVTVRRNQVGGNVQAFKNTGGLDIRRNVIDGNLQCKENNPVPVGGGNTVQGNKEDQCARL